MDTTLNQHSFQLRDVPAFKKKMLNWLRPFGIFCYLDNQRYAFAPQQSECLVAAGFVDFIEGADIRSADSFFRDRPWVFGHLSYRLKDSIYRLSSRKSDKIGFPPFYFFAPQIVLEINDDRLTVHSTNPREAFEQINGQSATVGASRHPVLTSPVLSKADYIEKINSLRSHILRGDCYEINFCQEFFADNVAFDPFAGFDRLMTVSPNPFSAFYRLHDKYLLCASPERFLLKKKDRIFSQPIKGTIKRDPESPANDERLKQSLHNSSKDQAENVMIVDLVRNDLTKICRENSVRVDELFGIYSFPQVHQMISTISGEVKDVPFSRIVEATFPMGSMTGAPKHRVMQKVRIRQSTA